jgi:hypothetical protein
VFLKIHGLKDRITKQPIMQQVFAQNVVQASSAKDIVYVDRPVVETKEVEKIVYVDKPVQTTPLVTVPETDSKITTKIQFDEKIDGATEIFASVTLSDKT